MSRRQHLARWCVAVNIMADIGRALEEAAHATNANLQDVRQEA